MFQFSQPRADLAMHPQHTWSSSDADSVVADQPRLYRPHSSSSDSAFADLPAKPETGEAYHPTILFSLYHDIQKCTLLVHLRQAHHLPPRRKNKPMDSYLAMQLQQEVQESRVVRNSLSPVYDQQFEFRGLPSLPILMKQTLIFNVFSVNKYSSADIVGVVRVKLEDAALFGEPLQRPIEELVEESENIGDILFSLTYLPETESLQGTLLKAAHLKARNLTGNSDPYIKVHVIHRDKKVHSWKSTIKKHSLAPVYNEGFLFHIRNMDLNSMRLDLIVMDHDRFRSDTLVGVVSVGLGVASETGHAHWDEMVSAPNQVVSRWHPIVPVRGKSQS